MEKLLDQVKDLYKQCIAILEENQRERAKIIELQRETSQLNAEAKAKKKSLDERERELEKISDLIQYRKDADLRMGQANDTIKQYELKVGNFTQYENSVKGELEARKIALDKQEKAISDREKNLENIIVENVRRAIKS